MKIAALARVSGVHRSTIHHVEFISFGLSGSPPSSSRKEKSV